MRILVTGSEGFLGKHLCAQLKANGHTVGGFDVVLNNDILNKQQFADVFASLSPELVIHLAAVADLNIARARPEECWRINVEGTKNVLDVCNENHCRVLFASTCCCYGNNNCHPSSEDSPIAPTEIYAETKEEGEKLFHAYFNSEVYTKKPINHTIMRLATFYGPNMRPALAHAVFLDRIHRDLPIQIHGSGTQTRTYTHVADIVSGIVCITEAVDCQHRILNISHHETWSVLQLAEFAMQASNKRVPLIHTEDRPGQIYCEEIDNSRLRAMGWNPRFSLAEGMRSIVQSQQQ